MAVAVVADVVAVNATCIRDVTVSLDVTFQSYNSSVVAPFDVRVNAVDNDQP